MKFRIILLLMGDDYQLAGHFSERIWKTMNCKQTIRMISLGLRKLEELVGTHAHSAQSKQKSAVIPADQPSSAQPIIPYNMLALKLICRLIIVFLLMRIKLFLNESISTRIRISSCYCMKWEVLLLLLDAS